MAEFKLGRIRFIWKGAWATNTVFTKDDIVRLGGRTYVCVVGHTSDSSSFYTDLNAGTPKWNQLSDGTTWKGSWATSTSYSVNDIVKYGGRLYLCNTGHTSNSAASTNTSPDVTAGLEADQSKWDLYATSFDFKGDWAISARYKANDVVRYGGISYVCLTGHTSAATVANGLELDQSSWSVFSKGFSWIGTWVNGTRYKVNDVVLYGGVSYVCNTGHTSSASTLILSATSFTVSAGTATLQFASQALPPFVVGSTVTLGGNGTGQTNFAPAQTTGTVNTVNASFTVLTCTQSQLTFALTGSYTTVTLGTVTGTGQLGLEADLTKWDVLHKGISYIGSWSGSSVRYRVNDVVKYGADLWICTTAHTSTTTFATANFAIWVAGLQFYNSWTSGTTYQPGDLVTYGGYVYVGQTVNSNVTPPTQNSADWLPFTTGFSFQGDWATSTSYAVGHVVRYGGYTYVATADNTSSLGNAPGNTSYWSRLNTGLRWNATAQTFTGLTGTNVIGSGSGATFNVTTSGTSYTVTTNATGSGYANNNTVKLLGTQVGGITPANDIIITVQATAGAVSSIAYIGFAATWKTGTAYLLGDVVYMGVTSYICIQGHTSSGSPTSGTSSPNQDVTGTYWNLLAAGAVTNTLTTQGDLIYFGGAGPTRLGIGTDGQVLRVNTNAPGWAYFGVINNVVYVSGGTGADVQGSGQGLTLDKPWATVRYAAKSVEDGYLNISAQQLLQKNKQFMLKEISNYVNYTYKVVTTTATTSAFSTLSTAGIAVGMPITFSGTAGGVVAGQVYYVISTNFTSTTFSIGTTALAGSIVTLTSGAAVNTGTFNNLQSKTERDTGLAVDAFVYDISHGGTGNTTQNLLAYYNSAGSAYASGVNAYDITPFVGALTYLQTLSGNILANTAPSSNYQTLNGVSAGSQAKQIIDTTLSAETGTATLVSNLLGLYITYLPSTTTNGIPTAVYSNTTISIKTGTFSEILPIVISKYTAVVGDELRGTTVSPAPANVSMVNDAARTIQGITRIQGQLTNLMANTAITPTTGNVQVLSITGASGLSGTATLTFATQTTAPFTVGQTILVAGVTNSGYNGSYTVTACTTTSVSYTNATTATSSSGTVSSNNINLGFTGNTGSQAAVNAVVSRAADLEYYVKTGIQTTTSITAVATGTSVTVTNTSGIVVGASVFLTGTAFATLTANTTYWVQSIVDSTTLTLSATQGGSAISFTSATGTMTALVNSASAFTFTNPTGYNTSYLVGYGDAKALIVNNYNFLKAEMANYMNNSQNAVWTAFSSAQQTNFYTQINYILDAIQYDMTYGCNTQTLINASSYYSFGTAQLTSPQKTAYLAMLAVLKTEISQIILKTTISPIQSGNPFTQSTTGTAGSAGSATFAQGLVQNIINWITNAAGDSETTASVSVALASSALQTAYTALTGATSEIQADTVGWVSKFYQAVNFTSSTCSRDTGYIVNALAFDMALGTNFNSLASARQYYNGTASAARVISNQLNPEVGSINFIAAKAKTYAATGATIASTEILNDSIRSITGTITTVATATTTSTNILTVTTTAGMVAGMTIVLNSYLGGLQANKRYFIASVASTTTLTISATYNGSALALYNASGSITISVNGGQEYNGTNIYNNTLGTIQGVEILRANKAFLAAEATAYIRSQNGGTAQSMSSNVITTSAAHNFKAGDPVRFSGTLFGNVLANTTYFVTSTTLASTTFTVSLTQGGNVFAAGTSVSGSMTVFYYGNSNVTTDIGDYIDALIYDMQYIGNYKSRRKTVSYLNAINGSITSDMYYVRNATGVRNMTLSGLTGQLSAVNQYGTRRPTAGAYVSLDPGYGPTDSNVWITQRSPYPQNVTMFGTACVGAKIDGALHTAGNRSIVANDFTTVLSDGIGVWCTGSNSLTELVSVFAYYSYAGYLAELGGKIRATNGNSSYGTYGTLAEGVDTYETPIVGTVNNRAYNASITNVVTDSTTAILRMEYANAGTNYNTATYSISGTGYNAATVANEFRDNAVFQVRPVTSFGSNFVTQSNVGQQNTNGLTQVSLAATDLGISNAYNGMRIQLTAGTGVGQYANFVTYNSGTKAGIVAKDSFTPLTVTATTTTTGVNNTAGIINPTSTLAGTVMTATGTQTGTFAAGQILTSGGTITAGTYITAVNTGTISSGTISTTTLTAGSGSSGITLYSLLSGGSVTAGTYITAQATATGTALVAATATQASTTQTLSSVAFASSTTLSFTPLSVPLVIGSTLVISGAGAGTTITINGNTGSALNTTYYVGLTTASTVTLYASQANALAGTSPLTIVTGATTGATFTVQVNTLVLSSFTTGTINTVTVGQFVGPITGIPANTYVTAINYLTNAIGISNVVSGAVSGATSLYSAGGQGTYTLNQSATGTPTTSVGYSVSASQVRTSATITATGQTLTVANNSTLYNGMPIVLGAALGSLTQQVYYVIGLVPNGTLFSVGTSAAATSAVTVTNTTAQSVALYWAGWEHILPSTALASILDTTTGYIIEPRIQISSPSYTATVRTQTSAPWQDMIYGDTQGTYTNVATTGGTGANATFTVTRTGVAYALTLGSGGTGYSAGDVLTILGTSLGGTTANNITVTVTNVASGVINNWTFVGTGAGGYFIAIPNSGTTTSYSTNGTTWSAAGGTVALASASWTAIAYGNYRWVAVSNGTATSTTTDALTWSAGSITNANWTAICYGSAAGFMAVASGTNFAYFSSNGTSWGATSGSLPATTTWSGVAYGSGVYVAIASGGTQAASSADGGTTWVSRTLPVSSTWKNIVYGRNRFVAVSTTGAVAVSSDGITWVSSPLGLPSVPNAANYYSWKEIQYGQGLFSVISSTGTNVIATSEDGITWTSRTLTTSAIWSSLAFGNPNSSPIWAVLSYNTTTANSFVLGATAQARIKIAAGAFTEIRMVEPGSSYTAAPTITITDPNQNATSLTTNLNISAVSSSSGQVTVASGTYTAGQAVTITGTNTGTAGAAFITGYTSGTTYYVVVGGNNVTSITLTDTYVNAIANVSNLTSNSGTLVGVVANLHLQVRLGVGALANPTFSNRGLAYATSTASISGNGYADDYQVGYYFNIAGLPVTPVAGDNVVFTGNNSYYKLVTINNYLPSYLSYAPYTARLQISPALVATNAPLHGTTVTMRIKYSQVRLTGHDFLSIGTGNVTNTNYPGTPLQVADATKQTVAYGGGRVFYTATDQDGNFTVGTLFSVQQATGVASINADAFNLAGLNSLTLGSVSLGSSSATVTSFSTDQYFTANSDNIVPTQKAIKSYIASQIGGGSSALNVNTLTAGVIVIQGQTITTSTNVQIIVSSTLNIAGQYAGVNGIPIAMNLLLN
jgi:hypothetical protein